MGATRGMLKEKLYQDLSLKVLQVRRWWKNFCCFFKNCNSDCLEYYKASIMKDCYLTQPEILKSSLHSKLNITAS